MTVDMIPQRDNRLAYWLGLILHPALIAVVTVFLVLIDLELVDAILWTALLSALVLIPSFAVIGLLHRRQRFTYQRQSRLPIYVTAWVSVVLAAVFVHVFNGPEVLIACLMTLAIWLPLQLTVNQLYTKISAHVAVASGCLVGLIVLGRIAPEWGIPLFIACVVILGWARIQTRNHTPLQIILGAIVGGGSALIAMPLFIQ